MPVDLLSCWLILYNARHLTEVHFWHVLGNDSGRKFPKIRIRQLESLYIHYNEAWLTNLLCSIRVGALTRLEVYYASSRPERFAYDEDAYLYLFEKARNLSQTGVVCISPNHPVYGKRASKLEGALYEYVYAYVKNPGWVFHVSDMRLGLAV